MEGPKLSDFSKTTIQDPLSLKEVLSQALGVKGVVLKKRILFMCNQTRIHIDDVVGLGNFMELEVYTKNRVYKIYKLYYTSVVCHTGYAN